MTCAGGAAGSSSEALVDEAFVFSILLCANSCTAGAHKKGDSGAQSIVGSFVFVMNLHFNRVANSIDGVLSRGFEGNCQRSELLILAQIVGEVKVSSCELNSKSVSPGLSGNLITIRFVVEIFRLKTLGSGAFSVKSSLLTKLYLIILNINGTLFGSTPTETNPSLLTFIGIASHVIPFTAVGDGSRCGNCES